MKAGIRSLTGLRRAAACMVVVFLMAALMLLGTDVPPVAAFVPLVVTLAAGWSRVALYPGRPVLHWLGTVSYPIYLVHRPVKDALRPAMKTELPAWHVPHSFSVAAALTMMPALLVSALTYRIIDELYHAWSHRLLRPNGAGKAATAAMG